MLAPGGTSFLRPRTGATGRGAEGGLAAGDRLLEAVLQRGDDRPAALQVFGGHVADEVVRESLVVILQPGASGTPADLKAQTGTSGGTLDEAFLALTGTGLDGTRLDGSPA